jgi:hypothetical protein
MAAARAATTPPPAPPNSMAFALVYIGACFL